METCVFTGAPLPVSVRLPTRITPLVRRFLVGWSVTPTGDLPDPDILLREDESGRLHLSGRWISHDYSHSDALDAACSLIAEIAHAQARGSDAELCLHAAASVFAGRAVLFPASHKAGKSTLTAVMFADGIPVLGDDVVFLSGDCREAMGFGVLPRPRLPLPQGLKWRMKLQSAIEAENGRYGYIGGQAGTLLPNATRVPLGAVVALRRVENRKTQLMPLAKSATLKLLLAQNFVQSLPAPRLLRGLADVVARTPTYLLEYKDARSAVAALRSAFRRWDAAPGSGPPVAGEAQELVDLAEGAAASQQAAALATTGSVEEYRVDGALFVADGRNGRVFQLNEIASAIWSALGSGLAEDAVIELLADAFPDVARETLRGDVERLAGALLRAGLLYRPWD